MGVGIVPLPHTLAVALLLPPLIFVNFKPFEALFWFFSLQALCILQDTNDAA